MGKSRTSPLQKTGSSIGVGGSIGGGNSSLFHNATNVTEAKNLLKTISNNASIEITNKDIPVINEAVKQIQARMKEYGLDTELIRKANNTSYMYEAGDAIKREFEREISQINSLNISSSEKSQYIKDLKDLNTQALKAQASNISQTVAGVAKRVSGSEKAQEKVSKIRGMKSDLIIKAKQKSDANNKSKESRDLTSAIKEAIDNKSLSFTYNGKTYTRKTTRSSSWISK